MIYIKPLSCVSISSNCTYMIDNNIILYSCTCVQPSKRHYTGSVCTNIIETTVIYTDCSRDTRNGLYVQIVSKGVCV